MEALVHSIVYSDGGAKLEGDTGAALDPFSHCWGAAAAGASAHRPSDGGISYTRSMYGGNSVVGCQGSVQDMALSCMLTSPRDTLLSAGGPSYCSRPHCGSFGGSSGRSSMSFGLGGPRIVKASLRPVPKTPSKKNAENLDNEFRQSLKQQERRAATFRAHQNEERHHNRPKTAERHPWPFNGSALMRPSDRAATSNTTLFDPITGETRTTTAPVVAGAPRASAGGSLAAAVKPADGYAARAAAKAEYEAMRASEARARAAAARASSPGPGELTSTIGSAAASSMTSSSKGRRGAAAALQGRYDPLRHQWLEAPEMDPDTKRAKQRDADRALGNIGIRCAPLENRKQTEVGALTRTPDAAAPADAAVAPKLTAAPAPVPKEKVEPTPIPVRNPITGDGVPQTTPRAVAGRVTTGWGQFDIFQRDFKVAPKDPRYNLPVDDTIIYTGRGVKRVEKPASTGVYDPIRAEWKVLPRNPRAAEGLDYAYRSGYDPDSRPATIGCVWEPIPSSTASTGRARSPGRSQSVGRGGRGYHSTGLF